MNDEKIDLRLKNSTFRMNRTLSIISGAWPYQPKLQNAIKQFILLSVLILALIPELIGINVQCGNDWSICAEVLATTVYYMLIISGYLAQIIFRDKIKNIYRKVLKLWSSITDYREKRIINDISKSGNVIVIIWTAFVIEGGIFFTQVPIIPPLLDHIVPLNESRRKILITIAEYPFDSYQYYYELWIFYNIVGFANSIMVLSIDSTFTVFLYQSLALFALTKHKLQKISEIEDEEEVYEQVISAISMHKKALKFFDDIESVCKVVFLFLVTLTVIFLSLESIVILEKSDNFVKLISTVILEVGVGIHLFFISWQGQMMIDQSEELFQTIYSVRWYKMPEKTKKLMQIMMLQCMRPCMLTAGGYYALNLENFGKIMKTTASYITVALQFR